MLVLTRRKDESIMIGNGIEIVVLGIDGDRVRIGIEAPGYHHPEKGHIWM